MIIARAPPITEASPYTAKLVTVPTPMLAAHV
jgi:hypothetical protein